MQNLGTLSELNTNTNEISLLVNTILDKLKEYIKIEGQLNISSYKKQIVAGTIYFIKVFDDEKYIHLKVIEYLPHENKSPQLLSFVKDQTKDSEIVYF